MPEPYRERHLKGLNRFLATGEGPVLNRTIEISALRKSGVEFPIELSISAIQKHNTYFFIAFIRDTTERRKAEEKIMALNRELARAKGDLEMKVLERTAELQEANEGLKNLLDKLERSNKRLEEFAYMSSHNLRAPLANLTSLVSMYGQQKKGDSVFDKINITASQLNTIVNDLTELVALDKPLEDLKNIQFEELLSIVKVILHSQIQSSGAVIISDFTWAPSITYFHSHLQSILLNLLTNAIKYRSPDRTPEIKIKTRHTADFVTLSLSDNGIGIDLDKHRNKLFGAFKRLGSDADGKGLGLYIVKRQAEQFGGKVEVNSKLGEGTEFIVYLKDNPSA
jgi:signal transduction histidine kinase